MSFVKLGETISLNSANIHSQESVFSDPEIENNFKKFANDLRRIAPKANDFLYFSAVMMHAAEASLINADGTQKINSYGNPITAHWEKKGNSWRWVASDQNIKPYKNCNGDIFPEEELLKAYKNWVGKPLCVDHKSNSVDAIRGIILDTYYDRTLRRVIALCALDKATYPDLARKVSTGTSTSVSMGTGVGTAICYDCGQAARTEHDFCQHMRTKSSYGEINIDLQPIELSIVVNGADPQAKIKHIIAAAQNLNKYLESKEQEIEKISSTKDFQLDKLQDLEEELKSATEKLAEIKKEIEEDENNSQTTLEQDEIIPSEINQGLNLSQRFASLESKIHNMEKVLEQSLVSLTNKLDNIKKEELMSSKNDMNKSAYFQGGGDANEPTPGQPKYPVDPTNQEMREKGDKQMVGQLDTGPVDGMHPGVESAGVSEEERKKMLARAELEQRAMRRAAALQKAKENLQNHKEAYFQGGGDVNEPAPHKVKYPVDKLQEKVREDEDKQMVGQKPFPGVGDVESLHPSPMSAEQKDELKRKQLLQRATLKARFVKAARPDGSDDIDNSAWQIFADDKLVLTASVNEISNGNSEVLFDSIATKTFGSKMLEKVRDVGIEKAASIYKKSQAVTMPGSSPAAPSDAGGPGPVPSDAGMPAPTAEVPVADKPEGDVGANEDLKETAAELSKEVKDKASDLAEVVDKLAGEQAEMGEVEEKAPETAGVATTASLMVMRKELNSALVDGIKKALAELKDHETELNLISDVLSDGNNEKEVRVIAEDAFEDVKKAIADANGLLGAFVKYARGTEVLLKRAEEEKLKSSINKVAEDMCAADSMDDANLAHDEEDEIEKLLGDESLDLGDFELDEEKMDADDVDMNEADTVKVQVPGKQGEVEVPMGSKVEASEKFDLTTKEGRAAYRAKLAAEVQFSDVLGDAHKLSDGNTKLDTKPADELGKVETIEEQHKKDMDVATAPPKVRKEAERLQKLISEGKLDAKDVDGLVAQGLDAEVVKYWKQFYGQAGSEGSTFASDLLKEHAKAKFDEEVNKYKVKIARAYELANEMVRRGLLADERLAVSAQVDEIMQWNDEAFESMKRVIAKHAMSKVASVPQMGQTDFGNAPASREVDLFSELDMAFANRKY